MDKKLPKMETRNDAEMRQIQMDMKKIEDMMVQLNAQRSMLTDKLYRAPERWDKIVQIAEAIKTVNEMQSSMYDKYNIARQKINALLKEADEL